MKAYQKHPTRSKQCRGIQQESGRVVFQHLQAAIGGQNVDSKQLIIILDTKQRRHAENVNDIFVEMTMYSAKLCI